MNSCIIVVALASFLVVAHAVGELPSPDASTEASTDFMGPEPSGEPIGPRQPPKCPIMGKYGPDLPWDYNPYSGKGPDMWGEKYPACNGDKQSPIDFPLNVRYAPKHMGPRPMHGNATMKIIPTQMNFALQCTAPGKCGAMMFKGKRFYVANVHFHAPSEHTLGGRYFPLEAHIVHTRPGSKSFNVISVLFDYKSHEEYASKVYRGAFREWGMSKMMHMMFAQIKKGEKKLKLPLHELVDPTKGFCAYKGSLTTPPCTEPVAFFMSMNVLTISKRQVHQFAVAAGAGYDGTNRPLQPLNGREVVCFLAKDRKYAHKMYDSNRVWGMSAGEGEEVDQRRLMEWEEYLKSKGVKPDEMMPGDMVPNKTRRGETEGYDGMIEDEKMKNDEMKNQDGESKEDEPMNQRKPMGSPRVGRETRDRMDGDRNEDDRMDREDMGMGSI